MFLRLLVVCALIVAWTALGTRAQPARAALWTTLPGPTAVRQTMPPPPKSSKLRRLKHLIFIVQENRSFDHYFGTFPGADGFPYPLPCLPSNWYPSQCFTPYPNHKDNQAGGPYSSNYQEHDIDGGLMDGFVKEREKELQIEGCQPPSRARGAVRRERDALREQQVVTANDEEIGPHLAKCTMDVMGYHDGSDLPNYWAYASAYTLQDHMFESVHSQSHPGHLMLFSGWSAKCQLNPPEVDSCIADANPGNIWGPDTPEPYLWTDITYLMNQHNVSWRVYLDGGLGVLHDHTKVGPLWDVLPGFETVQEDGQVGNAENYLLTDFFNDVANDTLPDVTWVLPHYNDSEHPLAPVSQGQAYVTGLMNAIMQSPTWLNSATFVVYDDMGGFYDHEPPPFQLDTLGLGVRVPAYIVSPWINANYIDHQVCSTDCYLKFIEDVFMNGARMSSSGRSDPRADYRDESPYLGDLSLDFDFKYPPRPTLILPTYPMSKLEVNPHLPQ